MSKHSRNSKKRKEEVKRAIENNLIALFLLEKFDNDYLEISNFIEWVDKTCIDWCKPNLEQLTNIYKEGYERT